MTIPEELISIAAKSPHKEICGLIDSAGTVHPVTNVSSFANSFVMAKVEYRTITTKVKEAGDTVFAIYHSHISGPPELSPADKLMMDRLQVSFIVISNSKVRCIKYDA